MTALASRLSGSRAPSHQARGQRILLQHGVTIVVALIVSRSLGMVASLPPQILLALPLAIFVLYLFLKDPKWCLVFLIASTCFGLYRYGIRVGPLTLRGNDVPLLFLIPWALLLRARRRNPASNGIGQQYLGLFIGALAFTLLLALVRDPDDASRLIVAWLRLFSTLSLVWIVPYALRDERSVLFLLRAVAVCASVELLSAIIRQPSVFAGARIEGSNGPNVEGLLGAILVLMAIHSPAPSRAVARVGMFVLGAAGLYFATSIGSLAAVGIALGLFGLRRLPRAGETRRKSGLLRPARVIMLMLGVLLLLNVLRPLDLPSSDYFRGSSAGYRLLVGVAGIKVFFENPVFGVGWQRSSRPDVIASRELVEELQQELPDFEETFYPEVDKTSVTVHNAYIQVLAEAGVVGGITMVIAAVAITRRVRRTVARLTGVAYQAARLATALVVACLVWMNDNPFFGAQPETILLATMLGVLAALAASASGAVPNGTRQSGAPVAVPAFSRQSGLGVPLT